jgi:RNA polymerase sigma factor (sigma-70 family)
MTADDLPAGAPDLSATEKDRVLDFDAELVAGVLTRSEALAAIYEQHGADVQALARRLCGHHADEIARDVFLTLWHAPDVHGPVSTTVSERLSTLTYAAAVDHLRRTADMHDLGLRRDASHRPELAERIGQAAWDALSALPPALRDAIALAHLSGYTYSEIAERLAQVDIDVTRTAP